MLIDQAFDSGTDGRHRGGAGGVTNVVGAMEVEDVGDSSRNAVGEFSGHGVFGHFGKVLAYPVVEFAKYVAPHLFGQSGKMLGTFQLSRAFREEDPQRSQVVLLARHRIAEDHRRAIGIESAIGVAVVFEGFASAGHRPFLAAVHSIDHARRNGYAPLHGFPGVVANPSTDLGVSFIGRFRIRIVVEVGIPALGIDLGDAVAAFLNVVPKRWGIGRVGENGAHPDNRDSAMRGAFHDWRLLGEVALGPAG